MDKRMCGSHNVLRQIDPPPNGGKTCVTPSLPQAQDNLQRSKNFFAHLVGYKSM